MQRKPAVAHDDGVSCVCAAAVPYHDIAVLGKDIDNFAFALIAPL
jgi:hypothetical protein